jgi:hypothetical protein
MSDTPAIPYDYQSEGGALLIDAPTYVKRKADDELYEGLKAGQFCYVLNARQMGKSSLKVRTLQRLRNEGVTCAAVDLQGIGTSATEEQWYFGIISRIARSLGLHRQFNLNTWWTEQPRLSYVQRFVEFLESLLLPAVSGAIVIFIDEVDLTLNLSFRDDFFGALRESYNRRADEPEYRRLTFALFGVATPSDLIQNKQITPFNIGRPVDLTGFQLEEAQPLIPGLTTKAKNPQALLQAVLDWTGGQPFLTQKLCKLAQVANSEPLERQESEWVEQLVQTRVIENWEVQDIPPHLKTIRDRLLLSGEQRTGRLLGLYQQIVQHKEIAADDSPEQVELRLTGLVVKQDGKLRVYNRIYEQVFNRDWLERSLAQLRPYGGAISAWLESNCQDKSRLLRGQALQDARTWAEGKSLGDNDYRFLAMSQELEKRDIQQKLNAEAEANRILTEARQKAEAESNLANQRLIETQAQTDRLIRRGRRTRLITSVVAAGAVIIATGASIWGGQQYQNAEGAKAEAKQRTEQARKQVEAAQDEADQVGAELKSKQDDLTEAQKNLGVAKSQQERVMKQLAEANEQVQSAVEQQRSAEQRSSEAEAKTAAAEALRQQTAKKAEEAQNQFETAKQRVQQAEIEVLFQKEVARLEQDGVNILRRYQSGGDREQLLLEALEKAQALKKLMAKPQSKGTYPATSPLVTLRIILGELVDNQGQNDPQSHTLSVAQANNSRSGYPSKIASPLMTSLILDSDSRFIRGDQNGIVRIEQQGQRPISLDPLTKEETLRSVVGLDVNPMNKQVIAVYGSGTAAIWSNTGEQIKVFQLLPNGVASTSFSTDRGILATVDIGSTVQIWKWSWQNLAQAERVTVQFDDNKNVASASLSRNGQRIAIGYFDGRVKTCTLTASSITDCREFDSSQRLKQVRLNPDGHKLITISENNIAWLWNLHPQEQRLFQLGSDATQVVNAGFSSDGKQLAIAQEDGRIKKEMIRDLQELLQAGCQRIRQSFEDSSEVKKLCP